MKNYVYKFLVNAALLFFAWSITFLSSSAQGFSPQTVARLQHVLDSVQNDQANPVIGGLSAAIKVDGLAMWQGAVGYAARNVDGQNNLLPGGTVFTTSTLSRIYSVTKTFTAPLVLELAEEGVLNLNDPIIKYMPLMNLYNPNLNSQVTIRQLLSHESGYQDWEDNLQLQMAIAFQPTKVWTPYELMAFTEQLDPPGTVRQYSHNNFVFLGAIIEAATGKPVEQLYRERFFTPLNLTSMYLDGRETIGAGDVLAAPHDNISPFNPIFFFTGQPTFPEAYTNISRFPFTAITSLSFAGGGLISNAADVVEWSNALFTGRATPKSVLDTMLNSFYPTPDESGNKLGYGVKLIDKISGKFDFVGHNGSAPGYRSAMFYQDEKKLSIVVLANFAGTDAYQVSKALYEALPNFIAGNENRKEAKIILCYNGHAQNVDRHAAGELINKGAYLGGCDQQQPAATTARPTAENNMRVKPSITLFPNPTSSHVSISYSVPKAGKINVALYSTDGKLVKTLYDGFDENNSQRRLEMEAGTIPAGVYLCRVRTADGIVQKKVVIR